MLVILIIVLGLAALLYYESQGTPVPVPVPAPPTPTPPAPTPTPTPTPVPPAAGTTVAWINESQGTLSDADAAKIVEALNLQVPHLQKAWPQVGQLTHVVATTSTVPAGAVKAYFLPNADVAGALGYHDVDPHGDPYIRVFTETVLGAGGTALSGALSISTCASHEACEEACDPGCQSTATAANGDAWAVEVSDPVESDFYTVTLSDGTQVAVSDFVTPAFFDKSATTGFDYMSIINAPFTIAPGGYAIINNKQVFGDNYSEVRKSMKDFPAARTFRRTH